MQRITISFDDALGTELDELARQKSYVSRSEAVRDLVREGLARWQDEKIAGAHCVANLSYIFDRRVRSLASRLAEMQHANHDLVASGTVVRLDHYHSLESLILKGSTEAVRSFADRVRSERGVRFGSINILRVSLSDAHDDEDSHRHQGHRHLSPLG